MLRYMIYIKNDVYHPPDAITLLSRSRVLVTGHDIVIRDIRISNLYIEIDASVWSHIDFEKIISKLAALGKFVEADQILEKNLLKKDAIILAKNFFNQEKFWSTHEVLEDAWKKSEGSEKKLLNGIILVAAALVHYQKNEIEVCVSILKRAIAKLSDSGGSYFDINMDYLKNKVHEIISTSQISIFKI